MTVYQKELHNIRKTVYANKGQIDTVLKLRNYMNSNYDIDLNLAVLSNSHCVSKFHLLRLFKKYFGQTPRQYLIDRRIEASKKHLINGLSVTETCFAVGFQSLGSFSSLFKARIGKSPQQFRKEQLSRSKID